MDRFLTPLSRDAGVLDSRVWTVQNSRKRGFGLEKVETLPKTSQKKSSPKLSHKKKFLVKISRKQKLCVQKKQPPNALKKGPTKCMTRKRGLARKRGSEGFLQPAKNCPKPPVFRF